MLARRRANPTIAGHRLRVTRALAAAAVAVGVGVVPATASTAAPATLPSLATVVSPATPIQHLVVIFDENISFDHYFGTYPCAANTSGQPFTAAAGTAFPNGLSSSGTCPASGPLLTANPNGVNPARFNPADPKDVVTCSQNHSYGPEQKAFDNGLMDKFPLNVGVTGTSNTGRVCATSDNVDYYDGNTVTGLWNYAQHFAMSDNSFNTNFGPSTPGALNLVSGNTGGVTLSASGGAPSGNAVADGNGSFSVIGDARPYYDDCTGSLGAVAMGGQNVGNLLNTAGLSWGFFQGGFKPSSGGGSTTDTVAAYNPTTTNAATKAVCATTHNIGAAIGGDGTTNPAGHGYKTQADYIMHHEPFQYYASTANPHHIAPASPAVIGTDTSSPGLFDKANHQYDMSDFDSLVSAIGHGSLTPDHLPAVAFLKAPGYEDGHAAYSDPLDEQVFVTQEINALEQLPTWSSTAVVIAYDDSDGWYDHVYSGVHNPSAVATQDFLTGTGVCGTGTPLASEQGRCGYGPRTPLLVVSPWAKANFIDHTLTDQSSILKFVEDNWLSGQRISGSFDTMAGTINSMFDFTSGGTNPILYLDPSTGQPTSVPIPVVPETNRPVLLVLSAVALAAIAVGWAGYRRRRTVSA